MIYVSRDAINIFYMWLLITCVCYISTLMPHSKNIVSLMPCFIHFANFFYVHTRMFLS